MNTDGLRVRFDADKIKQLRLAHKQAIKEKKTSFIFEGHPYDTRYAGYLLEYLQRKQDDRS